MTGPTTANVNETKNYNLIWRDGGNQISAPSNGDVSWLAFGGTVMTGNENGATVQWTSAGTRALYFEYYTWNDFYYADLVVIVSGGAPSAPTATAATSVTSASFTANWNSVAGATSYRLDVSTSNTFSSFVNGYNNLTVSGTSQSVTGLSANTTYYYRVRAVNSSGTSGSSNTVTTLTAPAAPTSSAATSVTAASFTANWNAVTGATSYRLDVSTSNTFSSFISGYNNLTVTATNKSVTGLSAGTTYYYRVRAVNSGGTSGNSGTITAATIPAIPGAPTGSNKTATGFTAAWNSVTGATSYRLDVSLQSNFSSYVNGYNNLTVTGTSQAVTGLLPNTTYYYRVRAVNSGGTSSSSGNGSTTTHVLNYDQNFIRTVAAQKPGLTSEALLEGAPMNSKQITYQFFDGLGRPIQTVGVQQSPASQDVVQPIAYDAFGREAVKYLPYVSGDDGTYKINPVGTTTYTGSPHHTFYTETNSLIARDAAPYSQTIFEPSPLNRPDKDYGAGQAWAPVAMGGNNKFVQHGYLINQHGTGSNATQEKIIAWSINGSDLPVRATAVTGYIVSGGYYANGQLSIKSTKDEQGYEVREYTNKSGQVILKKVQATSAGAANLNNLTGNSAGWALTYYIYDDLGNLRYVLPPKLTEQVYFTSNDPDQTKLDSLAFQYKYDGRKRMSEKKVPGAGWVYLVYDKRDRLVLTQDAVQRAGNQWLFTKYDALNRPVLTGMYVNAGDRAALQTAIDNHYATNPYFETYSQSGAIHGYSNVSFPSVSNANDYLTVTYYDNYNFRSLWYGTYTYVDENLSETASYNGHPYHQPDEENTRVIGQVTGTKIKVLDGGVTGGYTWLKAVTYYDDKYRVIQTIADNYKGGTDRVTNVLDFAGKVLKSKLTHTEADLLWKDPVLFAQSGNKLYRVSGSGAWNAGAASVQQLAAGVNGWIEFTASEGGTNTGRMVGLSDTNPDAGNTSIDYAWLVNNGTLQIYENGTSRGSFGSFTPGDMLKIERTGTSIKYYRNNELKYTSSVASSSLLMADLSFQSNVPSIAGVRASFSTTTQTTTRKFQYDHAGRLLKIWHKLNGGDSILLALNEYNELGQLVDKRLHSTVSTGSNAKQSVDYRYNIRGWLTSMNDASLANTTSTTKTNDDTGDLFGMNLEYNTNTQGLGNTPLYNGNISAMAWSNNLGLGTVKQNGYAYT